MLIAPSLVVAGFGVVLSSSAGVTQNQTCSVLSAIRSTSFVSEGR